MDLACIPGNSADPDQSTPTGALWSGSALFAKKKINTCFFFFQKVYNFKNALSKSML